MKTSEVIAWLDATFHPEYQEDYDNAGFLLGDSASDYKGALVALDLTPAVVDEAVRLGMSLIVTHHPFIFSGVKRLTDGSETGRMVMALVKNGVSVYAAHTNLDNLPWGVSGVLAEKLGMEECEVLSVKCEVGGEGSVGAGMVGKLPEAMPVEDFLKKVKEVIGLPFVRVSEEACRDKTLQVRRVALCGGSCAEFIGDAMRAGADIYLTGDLKYHDFQRGGRMVLADIGHYESEQYAKDIIFRAISEKFSNFACRISETQQGIVKYI
jgi:dinuclear metal center YbgI/SA1388 family protein